MTFNRLLKFIIQLNVLVSFLLLSTPLVMAQSGLDREPTPLIVSPNRLNDISQSDSVKDSSTMIRVQLEAVLTENGTVIENGLIWRVFDPNKTEDGKLKLVTTSQGGAAEINLEPGDYFIHLSFGYASVTKKLTVSADQVLARQRFVLDAGGIILKAVSGDNKHIPPHVLNFSIYEGKGDNFQDNEHQLILKDIKPDLIVRLNEGTYHIVSEYGNINAVTRADVYVEKGKLKEVQMRHRAAEITFKLVSKQGGEGIADTAWSVYSSSGSGDIISQMVGAFPELVLSEGDYTVIAVHQDKEYSLEFHVSPGRNSNVEVLLSN